MGILPETADLLRIGFMIATSRLSSLGKTVSDTFGHTDHVTCPDEPMPAPVRLMVVAHPDDESIFGGEALTASAGWLVVCVTHSSNPIRRSEFVKAMSIAGADYLMLDYADRLSGGSFDPSLSSILSHLLTQYSFKVVATHGESGEYGHRQHVAVHKVVRNLVSPDRLFTFGTRWTGRPRMSPAKQRLLACYSSQAASIARVRYMAKREMLRPGNTAWRWPEPT